MPSSTGLDIYLNHRVGDQISNDHWNPSDACSPPQPRPPQTPKRCGSVEKLAKIANLSADLNDKGNRDISSWHVFYFQLELTHDAYFWNVED